MLTCLYRGKFFSNDEDGYTEIEKRILGKDMLLLCPICGNPVYYNSKGKVDSHYSHYPGTACDEKLLKRHDPDNSIHNEVKGVFYRWITDRHQCASVIKDMYLPDIKLLTDLYCDIGGTRIAFELQLKHITPEVLIERRDKYKMAGIKDIWIFIREGAIDPGSPYERHYYGSNSRELYYYNAASGVFTYFKGLKREKFESACKRLSQYISRSCMLEDVDLDAGGSLILPGLKEQYKGKLVELRAGIREKAKSKRELHESARRKLQERLEWKAEKLNIPLSQESKKVSNPAGIIRESAKKGVGKNSRLVKQEDMTFFTSGKKKYVRIVDKETGELLEYEIISQQESARVKSLVCREIDGGAIGKGYFIKVYQESCLIVIEDWF